MHATARAQHHAVRIFPFLFSRCCCQRPFTTSTSPSPAPSTSSSPSPSPPPPFRGFNYYTSFHPPTATTNAAPSEPTEVSTPASPPPSKSNKSKFVVPTSEIAETYLTQLQEGKLLELQFWNYYLNHSSTITSRQASILFNFARKIEKFMTPREYFYYIYFHVKRKNWIETQLALNTLIEDGIALSNMQYIKLADSAQADRNLFTRFLAQIDFENIDDKAHTEFIAVSHRVLKDVMRKNRFVESKTPVLRFYNRMPRQHLDTAFHNVIIRFLNKRRDTATMLLLYDQLKDFNITPNMETYEIICRAIPEERLKKLREELKEKGLIPSCIFYTKLMEKYKANLSTVKKLHEEMLENQVIPDVYTYTVMIKSMLMQGNLDEALETLKDMMGKGVLPDAQFIIDFKAYYDDPTLAAELTKLLEGVTESKKQAQISLPVTDDEW